MGEQAEQCVGGEGREEGGGGINGTRRHNSDKDLSENRREQEQGCCGK